MKDETYHHIPDDLVEIINIIHVSLQDYGQHLSPEIRKGISDLAVAFDRLMHECDNTEKLDEHFWWRTDILNAVKAKLDQLKVIIQKNTDLSKMDMRMLFELRGLLREIYDEKLLGFTENKVNTVIDLEIHFSLNDIIMMIPKDKPQFEKSHPDEPITHDWCELLDVPEPPEPSSTVDTDTESLDESDSLSVSDLPYELAEKTAVNFRNLLRQFSLSKETKDARVMLTKLDSRSGLSKFSHDQIITLQKAINEVASRDSEYSTLSLIDAAIKVSRDKPDLYDTELKKVLPLLYKKDAENAKENLPQNILSMLKEKEQKKENKKSKGKSRKPKFAKFNIKKLMDKKAFSSPLKSSNDQGEGAKKGFFRRK